MVPFLDLQTQYREIGPELERAVLSAMRGGTYVLGEPVAQFEAAFAAYCGTTHAVTLNSGTSALDLALLAAGIGPGDEVITVPMTFVATVAAIIYAGATPVFVDIDPRTRTVDPGKIDAAVACVDRGGEGLVSNGYDVCGGNLAIRRTAIKRAGGFPTSLGRVGRSLLSGEGSFLIEQLDLGLSAAYDSSFLVWHRIHPERPTSKWVAKRASWEGVSRIAILRNLGRPVPACMLRSKLLMSIFMFMVVGIISNKYDCRIHLFMALGSLLGQISPNTGSNPGRYNS